MKFSLRYLLYFLLCLVAFAFSVKAFREPDLWWQLKTGEWIVQHLEVPRTDIFSYTQQGKEWINVKWLFEVLVYGISKLAGVDAVYLVSGLCWMGVVWLLIRISALLLAPFMCSDNLKLIITGLGVAGVIFVSAFRINGRPEAFSHLFTTAFIYLFLKDRQQPSWRLWLLVPLQILWTNLHEGFATGIVIAVLFTIGNLLEATMAQSAARLRALVLLCVVLAVSVVVHPYGLQMLSRPTELFAQLSGNKYTSELFGISSAAFWKTEAKAMAVMTALTFVLFAIRLWLGLRQVKAAKEEFRFPLVWMPVAAGLLYLATTAYRNLPFAAIGLFPLFVYSAGATLQHTSKLVSERVLRLGVLVLCGMLAGWYIAIVSDKYYSWTQSRDRFGLQISSEQNPTGAARYIQQHGLHGKCFSDYLVSSHLLYALENDFKTYVDLRDLDVFSRGFMDSFFVYTSMPSRFEELHRQQQFSYVVLYRGEFAALHNYLYRDTSWRTLFGDEVAVVYAPKDSCSDIPVRLFDSKDVVLVSPTGNVVNHLMNPFFKVQNRISNELAQAAYHLTVNEPQRALTLTARNFETDREHWYDVGGQAWLQIFNTTTSDSMRSVALLQMADAYMAGAREFPDNVSLRIGLGAVYFKQGKIEQALEEFEECTRMDNENMRAYLFTAECYSQLARRNTANQETYLKPALKNYLAAYSLNATDPLIKSNIGFISFRLKDCNTATRFLQMIVDDFAIPEAEREKARNCIRACK